MKLKYIWIPIEVKSGKIDKDAPDIQIRKKDCFDLDSDGVWEWRKFKIEEVKTPEPYNQQTRLRGRYGIPNDSYIAQ